MPDTKISGLSELVVLPAVDDLFVLVDISDTSMAATGTDKKIQFSNTIPVGSILQTVTATPITAFNSTTATIPFDNTIPQWTEGGSLIALNITPIISTSRIHLVCNISQICQSIAGSIALTMFRGVGPGAFYALGFGPPASGYIQSVTLDTFDTPGAGTSTYTVRYGGNAAGTVTVNGDLSARIFGGVSQVNFYAQEVKA